MIEFHPDPRNAAVDPLSNKFQEFTNLVKKLRSIASYLNKKIL